MYQPFLLNLKLNVFLDYLNYYKFTQNVLAFHPYWINIKTNIAFHLHDCKHGIMVQEGHILLRFVRKKGSVYLGRLLMVQ